MLDNSNDVVPLERDDPARRPPRPAQPAIALGTSRRIMAFVSDDTSSVALQTGLEGIEQELSVRRGTIRQAIRFLENDTDVGAVIVDISGIDEPLAALEQLALVCPPNVLVTAIGESTEIRLYRALVHEMGVTEYLPKPLTRDAVQLLLRPKLVGDEPEDPASTRGGHVVAICGAQGGAGATSIAVNLAIQLADTTKASVAILDLHLQDGESSVMLGVRPGPGLRIALEDPLRADRLFLERTAIEVAPRVRLIAADEALDDELQITEAGVRNLLALLRQKFNFIIIDLPVPVLPAMRPVVATARHVFVLLEAEVTGLRNARSLRTLISNIAGANRMFTVLNRSNRAGGLSLPLITKGLGATPDIIIPDLGKQMTEAVNSGIPAVRKSAALRRHLSPIVREITGANTKVASSWLGRFLGR